MNGSKSAFLILMMLAATGCSKKEQTPSQQATAGAGAPCADVSSPKPEDTEIPGRFHRFLSRTP